MILAAALGIATPAHGQAPSTADVALPVLKQRIDAEYPATELGARPVADVELLVTVDFDGAVLDPVVATSGGESFDASAIAAVRRWMFLPARRAGQPVSARVRVAFHFEPPPTLEPARAPVTPPRLASKNAAVPIDPTPEPPTTEPAEVVVLGRARAPSRGASDYDIHLGKLSKVPHRDSASLLRLAPGVMLTNEGGTGHPYQIFLRGFDAREGQDIEFTVDGVPMNEVGNPHGNGLVDTHFIIPELVRSLRVVEGPFAPQQANFAVAGSAAYDVGVDEPGLTVQGTAGSFNTKRLLLTWHPAGASDHTFGGAELFSSDGFGPNRAADRASAMGGLETSIGKSTSLRLLASTYTTHYCEAGVLRLDDVQSGRMGFFDTYDTSQGGDSSRHSVAVTLEGNSDDTRLAQSVFVTLRDFRLRQNLTGYLLDPQQTWQSEHQQRGDLIDQQSSTTTLGARGSARRRWRALGSAQELELGYFGRYDRVDATQRRDRFETTIPYRTDLDLRSDLGNVGAYADASLKPLSWVTLRGGLRADYYHYLVTNRCALTSQDSRGGDPLDTECFASDRVGGYRNPEQTSSTSASVIEPRVTLLLGGFEGFQLSLSHGRGSRSIDPQYINQDLKSPFARVAASELGVSFARSFPRFDLQARSVFFQTRVDKDLFFNETEGRNTLANGTTRTGWAGNIRATGNFFDFAGNLTFARATFDDTHLVIPYAPSLIARVDGVLFSDLPLGTSGSLGTGVSYIGRRPLPFEEESEATFLVDVAATLRWRAVTLGVITTNLFDRRYRLGEYNYVSDFRSQDYPTLVTARHFSAGEPRAIYATLAITLDGPRVAL